MWKVSHILARSVSFTELEGIIRHEQTASGNDWYNMINIKYYLEMFEEVRKFLSFLKSYCVRPSWISVSFNLEFWVLLIGKLLGWKQPNYY